jgi:chromosome partitioning protein
MGHLRLSQVSEITGVKRHALTARLKNLFENDELERTSGNHILLKPEQTKKIIQNELTYTPGKIIYIGNLKGGVGKTTISYLLADSLSSLGLKVCAIDLDVQANLTSQFVNIQAEQPVFVDVISEELKIEEVILHVKNNLDIIPSSLRNSLIQKVLSMQTPKHHLSWFNNLCLDKLRSNYDIVIVDTPPSLTTLNSVFCLCLNNSDSIVVPVNPEEFSIMGVQMFLEDVNDIRSSYSVENEPQVLIMMNKFFQNQKTNLEVLVKMGSIYGENFCDSIIKDSARLREAMNEKVPISDLKRGKEIYETINQMLTALKIIKVAE